MHGCTAGCGRMGIQIYSSASYATIKQAILSVDMWLTEGTRIEESEKQAAQLTEYLQTFDGVKKVSTYIGQTPPRYYLANAAYGPQPNYAQCLIEAETPEKSRELQEILYHKLLKNFRMHLYESTVSNQQHTSDFNRSPVLWR